MVNTDNMEAHWLLCVRTVYKTRQCYSDSRFLPLSLSLIGAEVEASQFSCILVIIHT